MQNPRFVIPFDQGELVTKNNVLVLNPPSEIALDRLGQTLAIESDDATNHQYFVARGFAAEPRVDAVGFDRAIVFLTKHTDLNKAMIARAWDAVSEGGDILVEGAKTDGADSLIRGLRALGLTPQVEPKSHGKIAWFAREAARIGAIKAWRDLDDEYQNVDGYAVRPGIFSAKGIDKGTRFFLDNMRAPLKGKVADFGGGYGVMTRELLAANADIETLDLYETSHRAIGCARKNIDDARAVMNWRNVEEAPKATYDAIISNPPFHDGRKGDPQLGLDFITAAAKSLRARGSFYMVANKHLPYEHRLNALFGHVETVALSNAFKLFRATRPNTKAI